MHQLSTLDVDRSIVGRCVGAQLISYGRCAVVVLLPSKAQISHKVWLRSTKKETQKLNQLDYMKLFACDARSNNKISKNLEKSSTTYDYNGHSGANQSAGEHIWPMVFVVWDAAHTSEPCHHQQDVLQKVLQQFRSSPCHTRMQVNLYQRFK